MMTASYEKQTTLAFNGAYQQPSSRCLDNSCTSHICKYRNLFTEFHPCMNSTIQLEINKTVNITGIGRVLKTIPNGSVITNLTLKNVLCAQELKCNLLSTSKATTNNCSVVFTE